METHPCTEICSKKEATAKNIFRFLEIRKLTYENKIREAFKKKKFETSCPSECFTLESGGSICSSKASKLENPSVLIQSLDSEASPSQSTKKIYIPWLFKLIIWKWKVKFKLHLFTILLSCRFSSKFILKLLDPQSFSDTDSEMVLALHSTVPFFPDKH